MTIGATRHAADINIRPIQPTGTETIAAQELDAETARIVLPGGPDVGSDGIPDRVLLVLTGPIGAGKSTLAAEVGVRLRASGRATAVLDLDEVLLTIGGFAHLSSERFGQARRVHGELVGAWLEEGLDVVAHGPFFTAGDLDLAVQAVPPGTKVRVALLQASFDVTAERVRSDPTRPTPFKSELLRAAFDRAQASLANLLGLDRIIDTGSRGVSELADELTAWTIGGGPDLEVNLPIVD
jgi:hypothetical protein